MDDNAKLIIGMAILGGIGFLVWRNRQQGVTLVTQQDYALDDVPAPALTPAPIASGPMSPAPPSAGKSNIVPIPKLEEAREKVQAVEAVNNPLGFDARAPGAVKAYRFGGVNYWLVVLPGGTKKYMNDAELRATPAAKKVV